MKTEIFGVYIAAGEKESVVSAAEDLIKDIKAVGGTACRCDNAERANIIICSAESGEFAALIPHGVRFSHAEEFYYEITDNGIYFSGSDDLGAMWGIYTFCEKELGIPPLYLFDGIVPERRDLSLLQPKTVTDYPRTRFRGWFINDEDLLGGFMSLGKRDINYKFYRDVVHPDLMETIVETALRCKINLLIPATLVNIDNPTEENLVLIVSRRGLYVSQHHIEPLGVSHFSAPAFFAERGYTGDISFVTNREAMVACWEHYAQKWAKYTRVIWQLGLRGNSDVPVWVSDKNVGSSDEARGKLISDAIQTQYDIIAKAVGSGNILTSTTVWMEGAKLLGGGFLRLPEDTIAVFADVGMSQMFGDDFFAVRRDANRKYGVYCHAAYWHVGPHLAEGLLPQKAEYCYRLAREHGADWYSVLNVGNINEFAFSVYVNAALVWNGGAKTAEQAADDYCALYAKEHAATLKEGIKTYFSAFGDVGEQRYKGFCEKYDFSYHRYENLPFPSASLNDGMICWALRRNTEDKLKLYSSYLGNMIRSAVSTMARAKEIFDKLCKVLPKGTQEAFARRWCYQSRYMSDLLSASEQICDAVEAYMEDSSHLLDSYYRRAASYVGDILDARRELYKGVWQNWFREDTKLDIPALHALLCSM